jgi:hypothetical protein
MNGGHVYSGRSTASRLIMPTQDRSRRSRTARTAWRVANGVLTVLFAFAVVVQVNDPDPWTWVTMYGLAGAACALAIFDKDHRAFTAVVAGVALGWAASIAPRVIGQVPFLDMFGAFEMESVAIEESREMYGLLLIAGWMALLTLRPRRGRGARKPSGR